MSKRESINSSGSRRTRSSNRTPSSTNRRRSISENETISSRRSRRSSLNTINSSPRLPPIHYNYIARTQPNGRYHVRVNDRFANRVYEGNLRNIPTEYLYWIIFEFHGNTNLLNYNNIENNNIINRFRTLVRNRGGSITGTINSN